MLMKKVTLFLVALALCLTTKAGEIMSARPIATRVVFTNSIFSSNITATVTFTNTQTTTASVFHTFQLFYTPTGTNVATFYLDDTVDGSNWHTVSTNIGGTGTNVNYELAVQGKWSQFRWRAIIGSTNSAISALYMGEGQ